MTISDNIDY